MPYYSIYDRGLVSSRIFRAKTTYEAARKYDVTPHFSHQHSRMTVTMVWRSQSAFLLPLVLVLAVIMHGSCFALVRSLQKRETAVLLPRFVLHATNDEDNDHDNDDDNDREWQEQIQSRAQEIQVEQTRSRLEQANTQSFLKRRPRKLPYEDARRWVQANLGCDTAEEYYDLVENGNLRTPYIPKRPEEYYTETREWISWEHFLRGCFDGQNPSSIKPQTGVFD